MSGNHKKTHNKTDPDEENLSDSLLGVLRSSRGNRNMEEQRLEQELQKMMDEKVKQLVAETNIPQLIQKHASKGVRGFEVNISKYAQRWNMKVTSDEYNISLTRSWMDFLKTLHKTLNNEELTTQITGKCGQVIGGHPCRNTLVLPMALPAQRTTPSWKCGNGAHKALPTKQRLHISWT